MRTLNSKDIVNFINAAEEAVDLSGFGPLFIYGGTPEKPTKTANQVAFQVFGIVLQGLMSKSDVLDIQPMPEPSPLSIEDLK